VPGETDAENAEQHGATSVEVVERPSGSGARADLSFRYDGKPYDVELKVLVRQ
jgi:hypothetical protein